jgi:hypothetical protein
MHCKHRHLTNTWFDDGAIWQQDVCMFCGVKSLVLSASEKGK